jgi:hypothetical protein
MPEMMHMVEFSPTHWVFFVVFAVVLLYPIGRILNRLGFSPFLSIVAFIPFFNLLALWTLAFVDWPAMKPRA